MTKDYIDKNNQNPKDVLRFKQPEAASIDSLSKVSYLYNDTFSDQDYLCIF